LNTILSKLIPILLLASVCLAACVPASQQAKSDQARVMQPDVPVDEVDMLVEGNNAFALDLYQTLRDSDDNLFYSPYSISLALAMTYGGARGNTEAQMAQALHYDLPQADLHAAFNRLDLDLAQSDTSENDDSQPMQLHIANAVWAQQDHPFLPAYLDLLALNYGAGIHLADFTSQAEPVRKEINRWVSDETDERIQDVIAPGLLDALTRMVLVNAIYFKADWQTQFDANDTRDAPFYLLDGSDVQVEMMSKDLHLPYMRGENFQAVELPYAGGSAAMDIIVPDEGQFTAFEASLDWEKMDGILAGMQASQVRLKMPKFTFRSQFDLPQQLSMLGMVDAFDQNLADFSAMDGEGYLYIRNVIHQAFVAVDEEGTEAAAATVVIMALRSAPSSYEVELTIDRPFFFLIRDTANGQILFAGRVLNPGQ
jgi:serpin B